MNRSTIQHLLLFPSILFWAWQCDLLWPGLLLSLLLALLFVFGRKQSIDQSSFHQVADLCLLIVLALFTLFWLDIDTKKPLLPTLRLLPLALFPLLIAQLLHQKQLIPVTALLWMKRKQSKHRDEPVSWFPFSLLFIFICLFSAGAAEQQNGWYFPVVMLLLGALLLNQRILTQTRTSVFALLMLLVAAPLAFVSQHQMVQIQNSLEAGIQQWLMNRYHRQSDLSTAIGRVGKLKLSDEILFRVQSEKAKAAGLLLQQGVYSTYKQSKWYSGQESSANIPFVRDRWILRQQAAGQMKHLRIFQSFKQQDVQLAAPKSLFAVANLPASQLKIKQGMKLIAEVEQPFGAYDIYYGASDSLLKSAMDSDLYIHKAEADAVSQVAEALNLKQIKADQGSRAVMKVIRSYFLRNFHYSLWVQQGEGDQSPLSDFLLHTHQGHCEYFATATVLLLREAGIAARYVVGYSVQEWDAHSSLYLVRGRDAHAWAVAEIDGIWHNIDNTPPDWFAAEERDRDIFQSLSDFISNIRFQFQKWRYSTSDDETDLWLVVIILLLFSGLAWRSLRQLNVEQKQAMEVDSTGAVDVCPASDWLLLEHALIAAGFVRLPGETLKQWFTRIEKEELLALVDLYYRLRFHPDHLDQEELQNFNRQIELFCNRLRTEDGD